MPSEDERNGSVPGTTAPLPPGSRTPLASRYQQMFPILSQAEIDRIRRFGDVERFAAGEFLFQAGQDVRGMYVVLSGRLSITPRDGLGQVTPVAAFAELIGASLEEMEKTFPGEVIADLGLLSGKTDLSRLDARAIDDVEALVVTPDAVRALFVAEAEIGERILRALILRRVATIELGFGGPVIIGKLKSTEVTRLSSFLERNGIPLRVIDPDADPDGASLLARFAPQAGELPLAVMPDGTVLKNPTKQALAQALGLVATSFRSEIYDVVIVGAGPAGLATAVYAASEGLSVLVLEALAFGGQAGASARIENYLGFPTGVSGQALMARAVTQAQKFGTEFSLSTEVVRLERATDNPDPDRTHVLELADGRRVNARAVVVATGARYRRPQIANLAQFEGNGVSYWASPAEARQCRDEVVALLGGGNSAGQAAVFLAGYARQVYVLVRGPSLSSTMSSYLIERIESTPNITVLCDTEVVELVGTPEGLRGLRQRNRRTGEEEHRDIAHLFVFTGADPAAHWLAGSGVSLDEKGFIRTGADVTSSRVSLPLETAAEGIFAVGDVRCGSVKRVGAAIGEGAAVVAQLHTFLAERRVPGEGMHAETSGSASRVTSGLDFARERLCGAANTIAYS